MLYISIFDAKEDATMEEINKERAEWIKKGKDKVFEKMCRSVHRYEVIGKTPLEIFFLIDTDDPHALNILTHHFGDQWDSITYPVLERKIYEALEEDKTIVGG